MIWFWGYVIIGALNFIRKIIMFPSFRKLLFSPVPRPHKLNPIIDGGLWLVMMSVILAFMTAIWPINLLYELAGGQGNYERK